MKLDEILVWSDERLITQTTPDRNGFNAMITEELGEYIEAQLAIYEDGQVDAICDITVFSIGEIYKYDEPAEKWLGYGDIYQWLPNTNYVSNGIYEYVKNVTHYLYQFLEADLVVDRVQAISDIVTISYLELLHINYDPDKCMNEVMKEISSRVGEYSEETKKWQKDKSPEAQANWYQADFSECKLVENTNTLYR